MILSFVAIIKLRDFPLGDADFLPYLLIIIMFVSLARFNKQGQQLFQGNIAT